MVIKTRLIKLAGQGKALAKAHLRYIQRDGVTKDGERGRLYDANDDHVDGDGFVKRCESDRHQFRFIVSPEDADELEDLKAYTRDLIKLGYNDAMAVKDQLMDFVCGRSVPRLFAPSWVKKDLSYYEEHE